jgi:hypothetical protein
MGVAKKVAPARHNEHPDLVLPTGSALELIFDRASATRPFAARAQGAIPQ